MAGEELLDKAIALLRDARDDVAENMEHQPRTKAYRRPATEQTLARIDLVLASYDANRQRAGEGSSPVATQMAARDRDWLINDPATVRVPREPTEAMLEAGKAAFRSYAVQWMDGSPAVWKAMLSAAEAER